MKDLDENTAIAFKETDQGPEEGKKYIWEIYLDKKTGQGIRSCLKDKDNKDKVWMYNDLKKHPVEGMEEMDKILLKLENKPEKRN